jgi:hypothetical protein
MDPGNTFPYPVMIQFSLGNLPSSVHFDILYFMTKLFIALVLIASAFSSAEAQPPQTARKTRTAQAPAIEPIRIDPNSETAAQINDNVDLSNVFGEATIEVAPSKSVPTRLPASSTGKN